MLAPDFIKDRFGEGTLAAVWFRNHAKGGMPGVVRGWDEHKEELTSYVLFQTLDGGTLYLPFADIYLSTMSENDYNEAKADVELQKRAKTVSRKGLIKEIKDAERGGGRLTPASRMPPGGRFA